MMLFALLGASALAQDTFSTRGRAAAESRVFVTRPPRTAQRGGVTGSLVGEPDFHWKKPKGRWELRLTPFFRADSHDFARTHVDLRHAELKLRGESNFRFAAGIGQFRFSTMVGAAPIDVINQTDQVEDLDGRAKLGQPYVQVSTGDSELQVSAWYLPYQRARTFPSLEGRLRPLFGIDAANPTWESVLGAWHPSGAIRVTRDTSWMRVAGTGYAGISRDPRFIAQFTDARVGVAYDRLHQLSVDAAAFSDVVTFKVEGATSWWRADHLFSWRASAGLQTIHQGLFGSRADMLLFAEYHVDRRPIGTPVTTNNNDVFLGMRLAHNDAQSTVWTAGGSVDLTTGFLSGRLQLDRRLRDHWVAGVQANAFLGSRIATEWWLGGESYLQGHLSYYF